MREDEGEGVDVSSAGEGGRECCAHHEEREGRWWCRGCEAWLCDACVREYASRDAKIGSCLSCGGMCVDPGRPVVRAARGGAVEDEADRRQRHRRDVVLPATTAGVMLALLLIAGVISGSVAAFFTGAALVAAGTVVVLGALYLLESWGWGEFGEERHFPLKALAIVTAVQGFRVLATLVLQPEAPTAWEGYMATAVTALGQVLKAAIIVVLGPLIVLAISLAMFFRLQVSESVFTLAALFLLEVCTFALIIWVMV